MRWTALFAVASLSVAVGAVALTLSAGERARRGRVVLERAQFELAEEIRALRATVAELEHDEGSAASPLALSERRPVQGSSASTAELESTPASDGDLEGAWRRSVLRRFVGMDADEREDALSDLAELAKAGDQEALGLILSSLQDQDADVREEALEALQELNDPALVEQIIPLTADLDPGVREEAIEALRGMPPERAGPVVAAMLADENRDVVLEALDSLRRLDYPDAVPKIADLTRGDDLDLAARAASTLRRMGEDGLSSQALDRLAQDLFDQDALARINAVQRIRRVGGDAARAYLEQVLAGDSSVAVRLEAQRALERFRGR